MIDNVRALDIVALMNTLKRTGSLYFLVSPKTALCLRMTKVYAAHPLPRRKLRKCIVRKRQAMISRARRRLLRLQSKRSLT